MLKICEIGVLEQEWARVMGESLSEAVIFERFGGLLTSLGLEKTVVLGRRVI